MTTSHGGFVSMAYGGKRLAQPDYLGLRPKILDKTWGDVARDRIPSNKVGDLVNSPIPPIQGTAVQNKSETQPTPTQKRSLLADGDSDPTPQPVQKQNVVEYITLWAVVLVGLVLVDYLYLRK